MRMMSMTGARAPRAPWTRRCSTAAPAPARPAGSAGARTSPRRATAAGRRPREPRPPPWLAWRQWQKRGWGQAEAAVSGCVSGVLARALSAPLTQHVLACLERLTEAALAIGSHHSNPPQETPWACFPCRHSAAGTCAHCRPREQRTTCAARRHSGAHAARFQASTASTAVREPA